MSIHAKTLRLMMGASALTLSLGALAAPLAAQSTCAADPAACGGLEAGGVVTRPVPVTADPAGPAPAPGGAGFAISLDGRALAGDSRLSDAVRRTDLALAAADVRISYDGLGAQRRLSMELAGPPRALAAGSRVTLQSALNYPAYVTRGEFIVTGPDALGGRQVLARLPVAPNGQAVYDLPADLRGVTISHRVYDGAGRFDETAPMPLVRAGGEGLAGGVEDGHSALASRNIPLAGGAITVAGQSGQAGGVVFVLGEQVVSDPRGGFVLQRILPAGTHAVPVQVGRLDLSREITIPAQEVFATGVADITLGWGRSAGGDWERYDRGRIAAYVDGRTASGVTYRASVDTTELALRDIFSRLDERDPRYLLSRLDPRDVYPTFGDDSTAEDRTPTSGQIYARIESEGNFALWGDFRAGLDGNSYARSDRTLYGAQAHAETRAVTQRGDPRASVTLYAANAEEQAQRDVLRATGGSFYQLSKADITRGSETVVIQIRNAVTGRVISSRTLQAGVDYDLNPVQGAVMLRAPLASGPNDAAAFVVVQYEYRPTAGDIDGYVAGGRAEIWAGEQLRFGIATDADDSAGRDRRVVAGDILWQMSDGTWAKIEAARSEGAAVDLASSSDGGLDFTEGADVRAGGQAIRVEMAADLADFGGAGRVTAYAEQREAGFASSDVRVDGGTGDEDLWGLAVTTELGSVGALVLSYDAYEAASGERENEGAVMVTRDLGLGRSLGLGLRHADIVDFDGDSGARLDLVARYEQAYESGAGWWLFGTATLDDSGLGAADGIGIGGRTLFGEGWTALGEVEATEDGPAGRILLSREDRAGGSRYLGWTLEADRELDNITRQGSDLGRFITGARQQITPAAEAYGETSYDIFGRYRTLTNAYGINYAPANGWSTSLALQLGTIRDGDQNDFERQALSVGVSRETEQMKFGVRLEARHDEGLRAGRESEADSWLGAGSLAYRIDDNARIVASAEVMRGSGADTSRGDYTDISVGYAYRPVDDNRLNMLARYRYLSDMIGQRVDGRASEGPRQESHVVSLDSLWRLDRNWTLGGKIGYRAAETAAYGSTAFAQNNAWLGVASLRWHVVHNWDAAFEFRMLDLVQAETTQTGAVASIYRHFNDNVMLGVGYNFGRFSDDLTDLVQDDEGLFINLIAQF